MSNLSELLPTGGGQNSVDFVATGTLASGQAVALKADGTVEAITGVAEGAGTPSVFEAASSTYISSTFDSVNNKVVIVYSATSAAGYAVVGTVSGTSISFGTPVVFASGSPGIYWQNVVFDSNAQKVAIAYYGNGPGYAIVGTVSGTSISFGSPAQFNNQYVSYISLAFDSTNNKVIIAYRDQNNSDYGTAIVATVSGTSISFGTKAIFNSAGTPWISAVYDSTNNKIVIAYQDYDGISDYGTAIVGTVSGTSISFGTAATYESDASYISAIFDSTNNKIVISYRAAASSNYGKSAVGTVSGTSISFGTPVVFQSASTYYTSAVYDPTNNKVVIAYRNVGGSNYGTSVVGTVSGTSISFGAAAVFESAQSNYISATYDSTNNKVVIAYQDSGNSGYGTGIVFTVGSSNNTDFIGITAEAISSAATGPVNVYGGINAAQTGLTIASDYYVQTDGSIAAGATSIPYDISSAAYTQNFSVSSQDTSPQGLAFSPDGTKMFMVGYADDKVFQYALSTAFDISTASYSSIYFSVAAQETIPRGLAFSVDGGKMFVLGTTADQVFEYTLSSAFNVSTASFVDAFSVAAQETDPQGIAFSTDGAKMFITGHTGQDVNEYALSTVFDVSTASYTQNFSISSQETQPTGIAFNSVGTKMFIIGVTGQDVNEYTLSTGFNVSTASFSGITFSVATQETSPQAVVFNTTGTNFYVLGASGDDINQYAVSQTTFVTTVKAGQAVSATTINLMDLT
jgi:sugar lactone lactonase YvrE